MPNSTLRIISRESPLAMWQAEHVRDGMLCKHPEIDIEIKGISTEADRFLDKTLDKLGGKGAFVKELESALLNNQADLAVHSMKDVVVTLPPGLHIPVILERDEPGDAFVSGIADHLDSLPAGSVIGTSSLRRQCQLRAARPDLVIKSIRGNVGTRLAKLDRGEFDALVLATSGLKRLGLESRIRHEIDREIMLPAIGQGALGVEIRLQDLLTLKLVEVLNHRESNLCVTAERAVNRCLDGGCHAPIAAHAVKSGDSLTVAGLVGSVDGTRIIRSEVTGSCADADALGEELGNVLLDKGADRLMAEFRRLQGGT